MKKLITGPQILLHPNIPKPLHGLNPRTVLGSSWWNKHRQKAYKTFNYTCWACGIHKTKAKFHKWLEGHECYEFDYEIGSLSLVQIAALCHSCHNFIHSGRLKILYDTGRVKVSKYRYIMRRGEDLLTKFTDGHNPWIKNDNRVAEWADWHITIEGNKYYSQFKDIDEWFEHYNR